MEHTTKGSAAARMAVMYITIGILTVVWTCVWMLWMSRGSGWDGMWYVAYGCLFTGVALTVIGFIMGHVGRAARQADMPPTVSATPAPGQIQPVPGQMPGTMAPMAPMPAVPPQGVMPPAAPVPAAPAAQPTRPAY